MQTEILNMIKPKPGIQTGVEQYQQVRPLKYSKKAIILCYGHRKQVNEVAFSHNSAMAASGGHDTRVVLWCLKTMQRLKIYRKHTSRVYSVAFSKCDTMLATGESGFNNGEQTAILIWNISNLKLNQPLYSLYGHTDVIFHLKFAQDYLVSASDDKSIRVWRKDQQIACYMNEDVIYVGITISHDDQLIAAICGLNIRIYHMKKDKIIMEQRRCNTYYCEGGICFSNNSKLFFTQNWNKDHLKAWNWYSIQCKLIRKTKIHRGMSCNVSSNSTTLAISARPLGNDDDDNEGYSFIHLIDISTWNYIQVLTVYDGYSQEASQNQNYVNFSGDDQYISTGSNDGKIRIFRRKADDEDDDVEDDSSQSSSNQILL